jgi:proline iminopeptidase
MNHRLPVASNCVLAFLLVSSCTPARDDAPLAPTTTELSVTEQLVAVNGTELFVKRMGAGEPIVVVHGGPVLEHGYLLPHLEPLAEEYELIFYDQRLSGRSAGTADPESIRIATFVDDIEALREVLGLGRIHLMGHSWGGMIAMRYAVRYGENLRSLVLLDSMAASAELWGAEEAALAERVTPEVRAELDAFRQTEAFQQRQPQAIGTMMVMAFRTQFTDPTKADLLELYIPDDYVARSAQFRAMRVDIIGFDFHDELATIEAPTLVLYGADEPGATFGGVAIAEAIPNATLELVPAAGHFPFIENPTVCLDAIRRFLGQASAG